VPRTTSAEVNNESEQAPLRYTLYDQYNSYHTSETRGPVLTVRLVSSFRLHTGNLAYDLSQMSVDRGLSMSIVYKRKQGLAKQVRPTYFTLDISATTTETRSECVCQVSSHRLDA
jgi:hypothetical protein